MEQRREEQPQAPPSAQPKPKRFRVVKLEERIAPSKGGNGTNNYCGTAGNTCNYCITDSCYSGRANCECW